MIKSYDISSSFNDINAVDEAEVKELVWGYAISDGYVKKGDQDLYDIRIVEA